MESASHAQPAPSQSTARSDRRWSRHKRHAIGAGTVLTILGIAITLVFNTLGVRDTAKQQTETKRATQLALFTQLDQELNASVRDLELTVNGRLTSHQRNVLNRAYDNLNYMAWLFNHDYLTLAGSKALVFSRLCEGYRDAVYSGDQRSMSEVKKTVGRDPYCTGKTAKPPAG
ncbi:MAG TPA: hypothetical protein VF032_17355 [Thermoleophilaceae bacterium]